MQSRHGWPLVIELRTTAPMRSEAGFAGRPAGLGPGLAVLRKCHVRSTKRKRAAPQASSDDSTYVRVSEEHVGRHTTLPDACALRNWGVHASSHTGDASKHSFDWRKQNGCGGAEGVRLWVGRPILAQYRLADDPIAIMHATASDFTDKIH